MLTEDMRKGFIERLRANPFSKSARDVFADFLEEGGDVERAKILRGGLIPLTPFDEVSVAALESATFAPATWDKRFARAIFAKCKAMTLKSLTPKQYLWLWVLLRRYRKSVANPLVREHAENRYERYCELLDLKHLPPYRRRRTKKTDDRAFFLDDAP